MTFLAYGKIFLDRVVHGIAVMGSASSKLLGEIAQLHVVDTREHTYPPEMLLEKEPSIADILEESYPLWIAKPLENGQDYSELVRRIREIMGSAFFKSCSIAIKELYGVGGSDPMNLVNLIRGYSWIRQSAIIGFRFPNVYLDLCRLPTIPPSACPMILKELIELGLSGKIMWGGDCWVSEKAYGAPKFFKRILAETLGELVERSCLTLEEDLEVASRILRDDDARIFKFP